MGTQEVTGGNPGGAEELVTLPCPSLTAAQPEPSSGDQCRSSQANEDNYPVPIATLELPVADMVKQSSGPKEKLDPGMFEWEEVVSSPFVSEKEREMPGLGPRFPDFPSVQVFFHITLKFPF